MRYSFQLLTLTFLTPGMDTEGIVVWRTVFISVPTGSGDSVALQMVMKNEKPNTKSRNVRQSEFVRTPSVTICSIALVLNLGEVNTNSK
jgi:hypothetical protein